MGTLVAFVVAAVGVVLGLDRLMNLLLKARRRLEQEHGHE